MSCLIICVSAGRLRERNIFSSSSEMRWLFPLINSFYFPRQVFRHVTQEKAISRVWFPDAGACVGSLWHLSRAAVYDAKNISFPFFCQEKSLWDRFLPCIWEKRANRRKQASIESSFMGFVTKKLCLNKIMNVFFFGFVFFLVFTKKCFSFYIFNNL